MRGIASRRHREEEEESVFVSMTDMTISFLIILMILLAFFASRFNDNAMVPLERLEEAQAELSDAHAEIERLSLRADITPEELAVLQERDPLEEYLRQVANTRHFALERLRDAIQADFPDLQVVISAESDALRFQGEGLFASGARDLSAEKRRVVERIAELLDDLLPCYSLGPRSAHDLACNPGFAVVEAVQIEGHTDDVGPDAFNIELASDRAVSTYRAMAAYVAELLEHQNLDGEPVLSVAAYGENRPITPNTNDDARSTNRRIDLRFIMYSPSRSEEIEIIRRRLADAEPDARIAE